MNTEKALPVLSTVLVNIHTMKVWPISRRYRKVATLTYIHMSLRNGALLPMLCGTWVWQTTIFTVVNGSHFSELIYIVVWIVNEW